MGKVQGPDFTSPGPARLDIEAHICNLAPTGRWEAEREGTPKVHGPGNLAHPAESNKETLSQTGECQRLTPVVVSFLPHT